VVDVLSEHDGSYRQVTSPAFFGVLATAGTKLNVTLELVSVSVELVPLVEFVTVGVTLLNEPMI